MQPVQIYYYSDILCIWAFVANRRIEQLAHRFGEQIVIHAHFCSVFSDARGKIETQWKDRDGYAGYSAHVREVAKQYPHIRVNDAIWMDNQPRTSLSPHLFVKAVEIVEREQAEHDAKPLFYLERPSTRAAWELRRTFFEDARDISDWNIHREIAGKIGVDYGLVEQKIRSSEAMAAVGADYTLTQNDEVKGSPTLIMNHGRQKLFGNVGYRLIEANVQEILHKPTSFEASWC